VASLNISTSKKVRIPAANMLKAILTVELNSWNLPSNSPIKIVPPAMVPSMSNKEKFI
jgi:hypothetical protein